jgi:nucleoside-diphosphate-sugar epimerase
VTSRALIIGGNGQLGLAAAKELAAAGWSVTLAARGARPEDAELGGLDVVDHRLDRSDTEALLAVARGQDLVLDVVAFTPEHGHQLARLAGDVGSLVVISTGAVYAPSTVIEPGEATDPGPVFPVPMDEEWTTLPGDGQDYGSKKAALEQVLLATEALPVSILRPGTLHGPHSASLHHWSFVKRVLDKREHVVLAYDGASVFATSAAANVARLVRLCAERPARRVLNIVDDDALTVAEIGAKVFGAMGHEAQIVTFPGPPREGGLGFNPWGVPHPVTFSMDRARSELGYEQAIGYDEALEVDIRWAVAAVAAAERSGRTWMDVFPGVVARFGPDGWFPYELEDDYVTGLGS